MKSTMFYLRLPFLATAIGLLTIGLVGVTTTGSSAGALKFLFIGTVLALLEISLSFDNAVVNANKLKYMSQLWQRRFLTWGILIAVFGMRIIFPIAIVSVAAGIGPIQAVMLAATEPDSYAHIMEEAHISIAAFGGTFLMMVALSFFMDTDKDVHWIGLIEKRLCSFASVSSVQVVLVLGLILGFTFLQTPDHSSSFLFAAISGLLTYLVVETIGHVLDSDQTAAAVGAGGLGAFLYLEVLDASFSFDGVIGAFALTNNMFLIAIGLGIGAFYVRSMTIMLVERETLAQLRYLEHGAFYSVFVLATIMLLQSILHVPEVITGLLGVGFIGLAVLSSVKYARMVTRMNDVV